ncbi:MAG TPA: extracellular solute-binding protein [Anaerolineae bacterium]|jgi:putative spermidine/putrescine transport system substrate-binding protein
MKSFTKTVLMPLSIFSAAALALAACGGAAPTAAPAQTAAPAATAAPVNTAAAAATTAPAASGGSNVVNVWTDSDTNISDWLTNKVAPAFQKAYPQYTVKVTTVRGIGNGVGDIMQRAQAAMQTGADPQAEVFEADPAGHPELIKAGLFEKLSASNVPNAKNQPKAAFLNDYAMAYRGSQVLLAYDSTKIADNDVPKTFADLIAWVKAHPGQFVYCRPDKGGSGGNFVVRALYEVTGKDPSVFKPLAANETPDAALTGKFSQAWDLLSSIHKSIYNEGSYPAGNNPVLQLLSNGSVSLATVWSDQALQALQKKALPATIKLSQLTDLPFPGGYTALSVPTNAKNKQGALDFVNFVLTQEQQVSVLKDLGGFPAVTWDQLPKELQSQYTSVIATQVPSWPGGPWDALRNKGWYDNVATNIKQGS